MTIEPVLEIFGEFNIDTILDLREVIFKNFACTDNYGLIFTYLLDFDSLFHLDYLHQVEEIFRKQDAEVYYVELRASREVRLERNKTENRLKHKPSKRDVEQSEYLLLRDDVFSRFESYDDEFLGENHLKINNEHLSAEEVATMICKEFKL